MFILVLSALESQAATNDNFSGNFPPSNLLSKDTITKTQGISNPEHLTDGKILWNGQPPLPAYASILKGVHPYVVWNLGRERRIVGAAIQADNNDNYRLSVSLDGKQFTPIWKVPVVDTRGMVERFTPELDATARFVRLDCTRGDTVKAVSEVRVFEKLTSPFPPPAETVAVVSVSDAAITGTQLYTGQIIFGIVALFALFWWYPRLTSKRHKTILAASVVAMALFSWTKFGDFHGDTTNQVWDGYHYLLSTKYYDEIGYFELYRCVAKAEREAGRGSVVDNAIFRNLDDNSLHPGTWTQTHAGRCRGKFSAARWQEFKADVAAYRPLFPKEHPLTRSFVDHGFNATPVHAAWLHHITKHVSVSAATLTTLAQLDNIAILLSIAFLWWGFGPLAAAAAASIMAIGFTWGYQWIGGSIGRYTWFAFSCAGLALLSQKRPGAGAFCLTAAGLLRLFPFAFVGGMGLYVLLNWITNRKLSVEGKRILAGVTLSLLLGLTFAGVTLGYSAFPKFLKVSQVHASTLLSNQMGLPVLTGFSPGDLAADLYQPTLSDPDTLWKQKVEINRQARRPLWAFAVIVSFLLVGFCVWKGYNSWQSALVAGPLLFSLHNMTSYDYIWVALMIPLGLHALKRIRWIFYFTIGTLVIGLTVVQSDEQHVWYSAGFLILMVAWGVDIFKEMSSPRSPGEI